MNPDVNEPAVPAEVGVFVRSLSEDLLRFQRTLHRSPELSWQEFATTKRIAEQIRLLGLKPVMFDQTGLFVDIGPAEPSLRVGLRADIDALPLQERTGVAWASREPGVSHSCGHDVHTAALLGGVMALQGARELLEQLDVGVRCFFQPAEETDPSGARMVRDSGAADGVDVIYAIHCDPATDVGRVGLRAGPVTAASDRLTVRLSGKGGHTSRPHLTQDVAFALAKVVTELPAALTRLIDVRSNVLLAWGAIHTGEAENVMPDAGEARGTVRVTDAATWERLPPLVSELVRQICAPYGVGVEVDYVQGVPAVVNSARGIEAAALAVREGVGVDAPVPTQQSMGGEDFSWLLRGREGALLRVGTRTRGGRTFDLHRGDLVVDPEVVNVGAQVYASLPFAAARVFGSD